jgi:glycosyltransferase involved in cell wall biosynthesis
LSSESPAGSLPSTTQQPNNLTTKKPPWRLLVIGDGPERERLGALATALGIADRVHFLGLRNDVREILPECDIYLHASKAETCTYAVTESMAAGIPAVMLNAGAAKEQIENGKTGFVFDAVDPLSFAACLRDVMGNPRCRAEMGRLAKSRWEGLFLVERAAERYHELYAKMVERLHR